MSAGAGYWVDAPSGEGDFPPMQIENAFDKLSFPSPPVDVNTERVLSKRPMSGPPPQAERSSAVAKVVGLGAAAAGISSSGASRKGLVDKFDAFRQGRSSILFGKFRTPMLILAVSSATLFGMGMALLALVPFFIIVGIVSRYLCLTSDIIKDMECVTTCTMLLIIITGNSVFGAIFAFSCMWISRWTHPSGGAERISYTIGDSLCMATGALLFPYIAAFTGYQILPAMLWFHIWRFSFFLLVTMPIFNKLAWGPDIACAIPGFPIAITQAFMLLAWFAVPLMGYFGITGWTLGTMLGYGPAVVGAPYLP